MEKTCSKCKGVKDINEFPKDRCSKTGYDSYCKICKRAKVKAHYDKDPSNQKNRVKQWQSENYEHVREYFTKKNNSEEFKLYMHQYYQENKVKHNERSLNNSKQRRKETGEYYHPRLKKYVKAAPLKSPEERKLIQTYRDKVKRGIQTDRKKTFELLGCSFGELKIYLESQFYPEMSWDNWGKVWEVDHIIGCFNFDLTNQDELEKCFHYTNLRPLFKTTKIAESFGYNDIVGNRNRPKKH
jgi:hypothetical protein